MRAINIIHNKMEIPGDMQRIREENQNRWESAVWQVDEDSKEITKEALLFEIIEATVNECADLKEIDEEIIKNVIRKHSSNFGVYENELADNAIALFDDIKDTFLEI